MILVYTHSSKKPRLSVNITVEYFLQKVSDVKTSGLQNICYKVYRLKETFHHANEFAESLHAWPYQEQLDKQMNDD